MPRCYANGPGRLAAQLVSQMEQDGHEPSLERGVVAMGQEFHYQIDVAYGPDGGTVRVSVFTGPMTAFGMGGEECVREAFTGTVEEYGQFLESMRASCKK